MTRPQLPKELEVQLATAPGWLEGALKKQCSQKAVDPDIGMMYSHTATIKEVLMAVAKIAITLERDILGELDRLVRRHVFPNRSRAIQEAVREKVTRLSVNRLARECAKLDAKAEQSLAEEGMSGEVVAWPEY